MFLQFIQAQFSQYLPLAKHSQYNLKQFEFLQLHFEGGRSLELKFVVELLT